MFRVMSCLTGEHDWRLALLAGTVCLLASLVAVNLFNRARVARGWFCCARRALAASLLPLAITSHHVAAMTAEQITSDRGLDFAGILLSPVALVIALVCAALVVLAVSLIRKRRRQFAQSQHELVVDSEEKLRQQNIRLDAALNNMTQGLCMFDADEKIVLFNRRFLEMYRLSPQVVKPGCTLRELIQHRWEVGLLDADPDLYYRKIMSDIRQGKTTTWMVRTKLGRLVQAFNQPMPGGGWVTTHEDVTERRRAEDQVHDQKLQMDAALNNIGQGLLMFDAEARLIFCNRRYCELYDLTPEQVKPGITLQQLLALRKAKGTFPGNPDTYVADLKAALATGNPVTLTPELRDGRTISIENHPMRDGRWVSTHEDITERRRAERQLQEQKLQLDTALNNMSQGLNLFDASNRLVVCNQRYLEMYRLSADVVRPGATVQDLVNARIASGTFFDLDPKKYTTDLVAAMQRRESTSLTLELTDGRFIAVISHPTPDGSGWVVTHEDVTERRRAEQERDRSQAFATTVIENVPVTIVVKDAAELRYRLINRAGEQYFGVPRESMIGKTAGEVFSKDITTMIEQHDRELLQSHKPQYYEEHPVTTPAGEHRIITTARMPILDSNGAAQYLLTVVDDRTHRKRAEAKIARLEHYDSLTGLPNRAAFNACIEATMETAARDDSAFALMCLDLDRFKEVNDVFGHAAGDEFLRQIAQRLQSAVGGAFLARTGGDEFVVIATDIDQSSAIEAMAERLLATVDEDIAVNGHSLRAGLSIGIAIFPADGGDVTTLIANADAALYRAKEDGRGTFRFFKADMDQQLRERRLLQQELRSAIERNELTLHYQPQARITGKIFGFEALVRWQHPQRGMLPPSTFIPLAEESGFIVSMGEWIMREACRQAASWPNLLQVAINLSPVQFRHGDLPGLVHSVLLETGLAPSRLELEITEGVLIGDFSRAVSILRRLKTLGVRIAMDDFGSGYSSLSYLQSFPFDKIKIDQAFISNLERSPQSIAIIRAVIGLARGLQLPVLAEGVETNEQLAFLLKESCDEIQGFLVGRPLPIEDYAALTGQPKQSRARAATG